MEPSDRSPTRPNEITAEELPALLRRAAAERYTELAIVQRSWWTDEDRVAEMGWNRSEIWMVRGDVGQGLANLVGITTLRRFALAGLEAGSNGLAALATALKKFKDLNTLVLPYNNLGVEGTAELATGLGQLTAIHTLDLRHNELDCEGIAALAPALRNLIRLQTLDLSDNSFGPEGAAALVPALKKLIALRTLRLRHSNLDSEGIAALASALRNLIRLQTLDLSDNSFGPEGAAALVPALKRLTLLQTLDLGSTNPGSEGGVALASALEKLTSLQSLNLKHGFLGPKAAEALASALKKLTSLQSLNLSYNVFRREGVAALVPALKELASLRTLDLGSNYLGPDGAATLVHALEKLTTLQVLDLGGVFLGPEGGAALAPALKQLTALRTLVLSDNSIGPKGAAALAPALKELIDLQTLRLSLNSLGTEGVAALVPAVNELTNLRTLDLRSNSLGPLFGQTIDAREVRALLAGLDRWVLDTEAKAAILGEAEVGKSSLARRITGRERATPEEDARRTVSFEYATLLLDARPSDETLAAERSPTTRITVHLFDFGGQRTLHSAHRFFLGGGRTVYVVVADATRSIDENRLRYWLDFTLHMHGQWLGNAADDTLLRSRRKQMGAASSRHASYEEVRKSLAERYPPPPVVVIRSRSAKWDRSPSAGKGWRMGPTKLSVDDALGVVNEFRERGMKIEPVMKYDSFYDESDVVEREVATSLAAALGHVREIWTAKVPQSYITTRSWIREQFGFDRTADDHGTTGKPWLTEREVIERINSDLGEGEDTPEARDLNPYVYLRAMRDLGVVHWVGDNPSVRERDLKQLVFNPRWVRGPIYDVLWMNHPVPGMGVEHDELLRVLRGIPARGAAPFARVGRPVIDEDQALCVLGLMEACELIVRVDGREHGRSDRYLVPDLLTPSEPCEPEWDVSWNVGFTPDSLLPRLIGRLWRHRLPNTLAFRDYIRITGDGECQGEVRLPRDSEGLLLKFFGGTAEQRGALAGVVDAALRQVLNRQVPMNRRRSDAEKPPDSADRVRAAAGLGDEDQRVLSAVESWWDRVGTHTGALQSDDYAKRRSLLSNFLIECREKEIKPGTLMYSAAVLVKTYYLFQGAGYPRVDAGAGTVELAFNWWCDQGAAIGARDRGAAKEWTLAIAGLGNDEPVECQTLTRSPRPAEVIGCLLHTRISGRKRTAFKKLKDALEGVMEKVPISHR